MAPIVTVITIPETPPSTNNLYRHRGHITYMTPEGKRYKELCQWIVKSVMHKKPTQDSVKVLVEFYFKDNKKRDLDNFLKIILDSCSGLFWVDDSQIVELTLRKFIDKKNPRVELTIL